jgi:hypothetical protein
LDREKRQQIHTVGTIFHMQGSAALHRGFPALRRMRLRAS